MLCCSQYSENRPACLSATTGKQFFMPQLMSYTNHNNYVIRMDVN